MAERNDLARGNCYQAAWIWLDEIRPANAVLCHGIATRTQPPHERMGHAWVEVQVSGYQFCVDSLFPGTAIFQGRYYAIGNIDPKDVRRYTLDEARKLMLERGNYGPWDEVIMAAAHVNDGPE